MTNYKLVFDDVVKNNKERLVLDVVVRHYDNPKDYNKDLNTEKKNYDNVLTEFENTYDGDNDTVIMTITRTPKLGGVEVKYI